MRNMRRRRRTRGPEISMLNLIDIIFTMLIFFMVATTFNVYSNLGINVPDSEMKKTETKEQKVEILLNKNTQLSILNLTKENSEEQYNYHNTNDILVSTRVLQFITTYGNTLFVTEGLSCLNNEEVTNDSKIEEYLSSVEEVINNFFNISFKGKCK